MTQRYRLALFAVSSILILLVGRLATGSFAFLLEQFWFASGALLLMVLALVDQPHFSKDANVFVNGLTGLVSLLLVRATWRDGLWWLFLAWTVSLVVCSAALILHRSRPLAAESAAVGTASRISRQVGRPEALFSAFLLWGAIRQFQVPSLGLNAIFLFWATFMILNLPAVAAAIDTALSGKMKAEDEDAGVLTGVISPNLAEVRFGPRAPSVTVGKSVGLRRSANEQVCAEGVVIDDRILVGERVGRVALTAVHKGWEALAGELDRPLRIQINGEIPAGGAPLGVVEPGTDISNLAFTVHPSLPLREGQLVSVEMDNKVSTFFQIVSARVEQTDSGQGNAIQRVRVVGGQLGAWDSNRFRFEPIAWVAPTGGLVHHHRAAEASRLQPPSGQVVIGWIPHSSFPVHANLGELVTHNTAILGVTGSGKTYLALHLIEAMVAGGIRVLILDTSRQHFGCLSRLSPVPLKEAADLAPWMSGQPLLGVHQFAGNRDGGLPQATAKFVREVFSILEKNAPAPGVDTPARMCIVFEEAHSLIPEWNQVAQRGDEQWVNQTARIVLQGRKFGLGSLIITQRTANVTKTILNQCNTIFALQSFDQTGLDFLRNYLGDAYAQAISTLPRLHGILVGRASSSIRPVIFAVQDMSQRWAEGTGERASVVGPVEAGVRTVSE